MPSSISWLDFSNADRRKVLDVLALFRLQDTRDELGLAAVRDTFADYFFPGTSTLQTRARYFLILPWLFLHYIEEKRLPSAKAHDKMRQIELWVIETMQRCGVSEGVIGRRSGKSLQRFPSSIYWTGLQKWGILRYPGSLDAYQRWLDAFYLRRDSIRNLQTAEHSPEYVETLHNWDPYLPVLPDINTLWQNLSFTLSYGEARYLRERLQISCHNSALAFLAENARAASSVSFLWQHPQRAEFPPELKRWVAHAQNFSECMVGAALLYNYLLARLRVIDEWVESYEAELCRWHEQITQHQAALQKWDRQDFWRLVKGGAHPIHPATERFLNAWLNGLLDSRSIPSPLDRPDLHHLIEQREAQLKRSRSRFTSARHRELWSGASGTGQLDYRWRVAQRLLNDILEGLLSQEEPDA